VERDLPAQQISECRERLDWWIPLILNKCYVKDNVCLVDLKETTCFSSAGGLFCTPGGLRDKFFELTRSNLLRSSNREELSWGRLLHVSVKESRSLRWRP
jgi:hypothetical protein